MNIKKIMLLGLLMVNAGYIHGMEERAGRPPQKTLELCAHYLQAKDLETAHFRKAFVTGTVATLCGALAIRFSTSNFLDAKFFTFGYTTASLLYYYTCFQSCLSYRKCQNLSLEHEKNLETTQSQNNYNENRLIQATFNGTLKLKSLGDEGMKYYFKNRGNSKTFLSHQYPDVNSESKPWDDGTSFKEFLS